ncbi:hypothetical protein AA309_22800 [Microvirga vignae]|uniref:Uncharacterized protein n=1 Tax=Microvirga vignae TaxID=1225564 RepID=A0A0H1R781_9HYPH|nr:hypothetical protein [Microvirga vignae]KLK91008.1 hypothetical protein AA309_22800 [Microvirga vignae]
MKIAKWNWIALRPNSIQIGAWINDETRHGKKTTYMTTAHYEPRTLARIGPQSTVSVFKNGHWIAYTGPRSRLELESYVTDIFKRELRDRGITRPAGQPWPKPWSELKPDLLAIMHDPKHALMKNPLAKVVDEGIAQEGPETDIGA